MGQKFLIFKGDEEIGETDNVEVLKEARAKKYDVRVEIEHPTKGDGAISERLLPDALAKGWKIKGADNYAEEGIEIPQIPGIEQPAIRLPTQHFDPEKQAVNPTERAVIKNLLDSSPEDQKKYLESKGYEARIVDGEVQARKAGPAIGPPISPAARGKFGVVEPDNRLELQDISDALMDAGEMGAQTVGAFAGGAGGAIGGPVTGTIGAVAGAGIGGAFARGLGELAAVVSGVKEKLDPKAAAKGMAYGVLGEAGGRVAEPAFKLLGKGIRSFGPPLKSYEEVGSWAGKSQAERTAAYQDDLKKAAEATGVKLTPGMRYDSPYLQRQENLFRDEQWIGGRGLRKQSFKNQETTSRTAAALFDRATDYHPDVVGAKVKEKMTEELEAKLAPLETLYAAIDESASHLPVDVSGIEKKIDELAESHKFSDAAMSLLNNWRNKLSDVKTIGDLKRFRTTALRQELPAQPNPNQRFVTDQVYEAATQARTDSLETIKKQSIEAVEQSARQKESLPNLGGYQDEAIALYNEWTPETEAPKLGNLISPKFKASKEAGISAPPADTSSGSNVVMFRAPAAAPGKNASNIRDRLNTLAQVDPAAASVSYKLTSGGKATEPYYGNGFEASPSARFAKQSNPIKALVPVYNVSPENLDGVLGKGVGFGGPDPFAWTDTKYQATKTLMENPAFKSTPLDIHTRSDLIAHDDYMPLLDPEKHTINIHVTTSRPGLSNVLEPGAPSIKRRMAAAAKLRDAGFRVNIIQDVYEGVAQNLMEDALPEGFAVSMVNKISLPRDFLEQAFTKSHNIPIDPSYTFMADDALAAHSVPQIGADFDDVVKSLRDADRQYAELANEVRTAIEGTKSTSKKEGPKVILSKATTKTENREFPSKMFPTQKAQQLGAIQEQFPESFEMLKKNKLAEIFNKSLRRINGKEQVDPVKLVKMLDPQVLDDSVKRELFGDNNVEKLNALRFVIKNYPEIVNPSGTSSAQAQRSIFNVIDHINSIWRKTLFDAAQSPEKMAKLAEKIAVAANSRLGKATLSKGIEAYQDDKIEMPQFLGQ